MHLRKGDLVKVLSGKDRGKTGKVLTADLKLAQATVEGRNILVRHQKPKKAGQKGQKIQVPMPIRVSRLMVICPHCKKPARVGHATDEKGIKSRICKKCNKRI